MKKHRLHDIVLGMVIMALVMGLAAPAFATVATNTLQAHYMNIRLVIDGVEVVPKDAGGNVVEPFVVDGTTFLPVRAVGEALGKKVTWDGNTKTVYLGEVPEGAIKDWVGVKQNFGVRYLSELQDLPAIAAAITETNATVAPGEHDLAIRPADAPGTQHIYLQSHTHDYPNGFDAEPRYEYCIRGLGDYVGWQDSTDYLKIVKAILDELISDPEDAKTIYDMVVDADKNGTVYNKPSTLNTVVVDWQINPNYGGNEDLIIYNK